MGLYEAFRRLCTHFFGTITGGLEGFLKEIFRGLHGSGGSTRSAVTLPA
jgi:hypothetical protein